MTSLSLGDPAWSTMISNDLGYHWHISFEKNYMDVSPGRSRKLSCRQVTKSSLEELEKWIFL